MMSRRKMLLGAAGIGVGAGLCVPVSALGSIENQSAVQFVSAASDSDGAHFVRSFSVNDKSFEQVFSYVLPGRAHHIAVNELTGVYVVVARRPGIWMAVGKLFKNKAPAIVTIPEGRRLCGHGFFSQDGQRFFSLEIDSHNQGDDGLLVVWNVKAGGDLERLSEFRTFGVGPHEGALMPDGKTVAIANGGIRTSLGSDRKKLNLDIMKPSLVYLNSRSGELIQKVQLSPELYQNSIRHLDVNNLGQVAVALQYEGEPFQNVPLVALHSLGDSEMVIPDIPLQEQQQLKQYCGSVRFDGSGQYFAVSSPRGNRITFWSVENNQFINSVRSRDGCGVCAYEQGFVFTSGTGKVSYLNLDSQQVTSLENQSGLSNMWDNHLSRV